VSFKNPLPNYINGEWCISHASEFLNVVNPATTDVLTQVPLSPKSDVEAATQAAATAFTSWRRVPPTDRIQYLFKLKFLLEDHIDELSRTITLECGKTYGESKAEWQRAIENVEVACGIPMLMQGYNLEVWRVGLTK
jgi:malonate-semialdehyde dehydrogenase (acetylating)/methylmalonate-semialdehyde dehydrogenase